MNTDPKTFVTIDRFFHPTEAHIAAGVLQAEGIPVHLLGINHASANWLVTGALGGIQLQVPAEFAALSRKLIADVQPLDDPEINRCPNCGSLDISSTSGSWKLAFLAVHLFSIPLPWRKDRKRCQDCRSEWLERDAT